MFTRLARPRGGDLRQLRRPDLNQEDRLSQAFTIEYVLTVCTRKHLVISQQQTQAQTFSCEVRPRMFDVCRTMTLSTSLRSLTCDY